MTAVADLPRLLRRKQVPRPGIVHFGPGAFFRAFIATATDTAMAQAGGDWGIVAVSLRSSATRDLLVPQGCVFTAVARGETGDVPRVVGAIAEVLVAAEDPGAVLDRLADPAIRVVTLTVTEKGYGHLPGSGGMDPDHPEIAHDLAHPDAPASAAGFLVAGLARRRAAGRAPFAVLSCDNLPDNGALVRSVVVDLARHRDPGLAEWIAAHVPFPSSMVDRITPAATVADIEGLGAAAGWYDPAMVVHEPFRQWVIEDRFATSRPAWDAAGAQFVDRVAAHEAMKLRCLNGTHSALAYLGGLAGHTTVADAVGDPRFAGFLQAMWTEEILPGLDPPRGQDLHAYTAALMARYRNPAIRHRLAQIAMDGSRKLPQRILAPMLANAAVGRRSPRLALVVAGWMHGAGLCDTDGRPVPVRDPLANSLGHAARQSGSQAIVDAFLDLDSVFPPAFAADAGLRADLVAAHERLTRHGAGAAVAELAAVQ